MKSEHNDFVKKVEKVSRSNASKTQEIKNGLISIISWRGEKIELITTHKFHKMVGTEGLPISCSKRGEYSN